jgi:putative ABC transport system permease protein
MLIRDTMGIAWRALQANKLRSLLTMAGLIIGVGAVIVLAACTQGVRNSVDASIEPVANNINIIPLQPQVPGGPDAEPLTDHDATALAKLPDIVLITPSVTGSTTSQAGQDSHAVVVATPTEKFLSATVTGTTANWFQTNNRLLTVGTYFTPAQARAGAKVAVIGPDLAEVLFGSPQAAVGTTIRVANAPFMVVGVMKDYGRNLDNNVVVPEAAARSAVFGYGYNGDVLNSITATARSTFVETAAVREITQTLSARHHITNPRLADFQVQTLGVRLTTFNQLLDLLTGFGPVVAAISLVVGGIGLLNIMLVSVTDRTREIGIRKAIGAKRRAILSQFVLEASVLAGLGGLVGVGLGVGVNLAVSAAAPLLDRSGGVLSTFAPVFSVSPIVAAFGISLVIGVLAGAYPAYRAAHQHPIEALRYE